jgi:hypothetical protein
MKCGLIDEACEKLIQTPTNFYRLICTGIGLLIDDVDFKFPHEFYVKK